MKGHDKGVWCLNYLKDGKRLLSASSDSMAKLWDVSSGKCTATLKKHTGRVSQNFTRQRTSNLNPKKAQISDMYFYIALLCSIK